MDKVALPDDIESLVDHMLQHYLSDMLRDSYCNERWHERNWRLPMIESVDRGWYQYKK